MARRYSRRRNYPRRVKTAKYSNETFTLSETFASGGNPLNISGAVIPTTNVLGMRKAKNFTITLAYKSTANDQLPRAIYWALVYVPQGTSPQQINVGNQTNFLSLYEPNQNVIISGVIVLDEQSKTYRTRLARNLNSGDTVYLVIQGDSGGEFTDSINACINYAISY